MKELDRYQIMKKLISKHITEEEARIMIGLNSVRQVRRIKKRVLEMGADGVRHKSRGRKSNRKIAREEESKIIEIINDQYSDFKPTFASEKLKENHNIILGVETLRQIMIRNKLWKPKKRKGARERHVWRARKRKPGLFPHLADHVLFFFVQDRVCPSVPHRSIIGTPPMLPFLNGLPVDTKLFRQLLQRPLRLLYFFSDGLRGSSPLVKYLSHSNERERWRYCTPLLLGIKHLMRILDIIVDDPVVGVAKALRIPNGQRRYGKDEEGMATFENPLAVFTGNTLYEFGGWRAFYNGMDRLKKIHNDSFPQASYSLSLQTSSREV